ncbi:Coenzyme F420 hydrogenase/dehydrogenase, beta subunit C-terminal domain [uncultured Slackia sp.]|uniref:Coenzyme F420 hydrogenase/dehydrogenase, beta subunit C-terminal domain n=1 Tax=uncultured Slackia sp. TaxID=665903 RepID=UPI0025F660C1|nr:Coenzyme F420 hydrogenase/dehydrogenase, beta subunit C-terminal domain [uncultured Slackia sp.]
MADNASQSRKTCLAAVGSDDNELMFSSSGGAFSVLARRVIARGGVVYGHAFDDGLHVNCVRAENLDELAAMRGSKYVQSDMGDAIASVGRDLSAGREVLFSGTPCQVDGLLAFLGGPRDGLLTVDIVCHGVPSQAFFADCMGEEFADWLLSLRFRDKREGWGCGGGATILHAGIEKDVPFSPEISYYYKRFLAGDVYRESCYRCPYAGGERPGDFTIGDFWGIDVNSSGLDARRGISLVIANTAKAEELIPYIKSETSWAERPLEEAVRGNDQLMHPTPRPESRDVVLERWKEEGIDVLEDEYRRSTLISSKEWLAKRAVKKFLKGVLGR